MRLSKEELAGLTRLALEAVDEVRLEHGHSQDDLVDGMSTWSYFKIAQANLDTELFEKTHSENDQKDFDKINSFCQNHVIGSLDEKIDYIYEHYNKSLADKILSWVGLGD